MWGPNIYGRLWKFHFRINFDEKNLTIQKVLLCVKHPCPWSYWSKREKNSTPKNQLSLGSFVNLVKIPKIGLKTGLSHHSPSFGLKAKVNMVSCTPGQVVLFRQLNRKCAPPISWTRIALLICQSLKGFKCFNLKKFYRLQEK